MFIVPIVVLTFSTHVSTHTWVSDSGIAVFLALADSSSPSGEGTHRQDVQASWEAHQPQCAPVAYWWMAFGKERWHSWCLAPMQLPEGLLFVLLLLQLWGDACFENPKKDGSRLNFHVLHMHIYVVGTWWVMICKEQQRLRTKAIKDTNKICAIESTHLASLDISILVGPAMYNLLFAVVVSLIQEEFIATMHTIVTKKQSFKIKKEEGWYSEEEMRNDLGWNQYQPYFLFLFVTCSTTILLLDLFSFWII